MAIRRRVTLVNLKKAEQSAIRKEMTDVNFHAIDWDNLNPVRNSIAASARSTHELVNFQQQRATVSLD
jgi:hypothetical protein